MRIASWNCRTCAGRIARGCGFAGFADTIARARNETAPQQRIEAAAYWNARMEHDGIVAVGDICNGTSTFELKRNSRIHYHNFIEGFGLRTTDFSFLRRIAAESEALGLSASVTPHATYSLRTPRSGRSPQRETRCRYTLWKAAANRNFSKNGGPFTNGTSGKA